MDFKEMSTFKDNVTFNDNVTTMKRNDVRTLAKSYTMYKIGKKIL